MITHIVLFKLKDSDPKTIEETQRVLSELRGKIPVLIDLEVGTDLVHGARSYDIALIAKFASLEDLQAYQVHPEHVAVLGHMNKVREAAVSVDYETAEGCTCA